jgi:membrane protease YdiL (CAAX protease family)
LLIVAVLFVFGGLPLQLFFGEVGLLLAQAAFILLPVVILVRKGGFDPVDTLSLRIPSSSQVVGGVLLLAGGLQLALVLAWLQSFVVPVPIEYIEAMSGVLKADSLPRFLWLLLLVAVLPAVAEEALFRGVVLSAFRQRLPTVWAVIAVGLVFGLFHLTPETAFRFLPTAIPEIQGQSATPGEGRPPLPLLLTGPILFLLGLSVLRRNRGKPAGS